MSFFKPPINLSRNFLATCAIATVLTVVIATTSQATTWTVETDGTGDFEIIQNAVDVAASGDTIRIGTGQFDHKRQVTTPGWTVFARIHVTQHELTIVGNGPELTIVGQPDAFDLSQGEHHGLVSDRYTGNEILNISGLKFQNMKIGISAGEGTSSDISNCVFVGNRYGVDLSADFSTVANCVFSDGPGDGFNLLSYQQNEIHIINCDFSFPNSIVATRHVSLGDTQFAVVDNCKFSLGAEGIASSSPISQVSNSNFAGQGDSGIAGHLGTMQVSGCRFTDQSTAIYQFNSRSSFEVKDCDFINVSQASFRFWDSDGRGFFDNCNLTKGESFVVQGFSPYVDTAPLQEKTKTGSHLTFTNNWWGTTDPDSISAWIYDSNDRADSDEYYIDWEPYLTDEVATEKKGFGDLKAMFR